MTEPKEIMELTNSQLSCLRDDISIIINNINRKTSVINEIPNKTAEIKDVSLNITEVSQIVHCLGKMIDMIRSSNLNRTTENNTVIFHQLVEGAFIPQQGSKDAAGYDLFVSPAFQPVTLQPGKRTLVSTGIAWQPSNKQWYFRIAPRSGLSLKGIDIGGGVVDSDYRGDISVIVINNGENPFEITPGQKIAQGIITPFVSPTVKTSLSGLSQTERGSQGFGSTDK